MFAARNSIGMSGNPVMRLSPSLWLDANSLSLADGSLVDTWPDLSGNSRSATASGGARPTFKTSILSGRPIIRFNGSNYMDATASDSWAPTGSATFFSVTKSAKTSMAQTSYNCIFMYGTAATGGAVFVLYGDEGNFGNYGNDGIGVSQYGNGMGLANKINQWNIQSVEKPATTGTWSQWVNGGNLVQKSMTTGTVLGSQFRIGAFNSAIGLGSYLEGDIAEIIVFPTALSTADRQAVESYLNQKYAIY